MTDGKSGKSGRKHRRSAQRIREIGKLKVKLGSVLQGLGESHLGHGGIDQDLLRHDIDLAQHALDNRVLTGRRKISNTLLRRLATMRNRSSFSPLVDPSSESGSVAGLWGVAAPASADPNGALPALAVRDETP